MCTPISAFHGVVEEFVGPSAKNFEVGNYSLVTIRNLAVGSRAVLRRRSSSKRRNFLHHLVEVLAAASTCILVSVVGTTTATINRRPFRTVFSRSTSRARRRLLSPPGPRLRPPQPRPENR